MNDIPYLISKKDDRIGIVYTTGKVESSGQITGFTIDYNDIFQFQKPVCIICARENNTDNAGRLYISKDNLTGDSELTNFTRVFRAIDTNTDISGLHAYELTFTYPSLTLILNTPIIAGTGGGGGTATDVRINGISITANDIANIITNSTYNASSNKIATMSDVPSNIENGTGTNAIQEKMADSTVNFTGRNPNAEALDSSLSTTINTGASGNQSAAFNKNTMALGTASFANGNKTVAKGEESHAEGYQTVTLGDGSHAEGSQTVAKGMQSHAEGGLTQALGDGSHSEGYSTIAGALASHAEGSQTKVGNYSQENGIGADHTTPDPSPTPTPPSPGYVAEPGEGSHVEGYNNIVKGYGSHGEGLRNYVTGNYSHAEGVNNTLSGNYSQVSGFNNINSGDISTVSGNWNTNSGYGATVLGSHNTNTEDFAVVIGEYSDSSTAGVFTIGNGTSSTPSNAFTVTSAGVAIATEFVGSLTGNATSADLASSVTVNPDGSYVGALLVNSNSNPNTIVRKDTVTVTSDGRLTVGAGPVNNLDVATKQYVDAGQVLLEAQIDAAGHKISSSLANNILTTSLLDKNNNTISTTSVTLEAHVNTYIASGTYNSQDEELVFTYNTGGTIVVSLSGLMDDLESLIETEATARLNGDLFLQQGIDAVGHKIEIGINNRDFTINLLDANDTVISTSTQTYSVADANKYIVSGSLVNGIVTFTYNDGDYFTVDISGLISGIEPGAEVNTIESISVDGNAITPDANRNVDLPVVDLSHNQVISGQKDFNTIPRVKVTHTVHNLPDIYQEVEYIESTGTQYINTNIILTNLHSVEIDYQLTATPQPDRRGLYGILSNSSASRFGSICSPSNSYLEHGYGTGNTYWQSAVPDTARHTLKQDKNITYLDGEVIYTFDTATFTTTGYAYLGNFNYTNYIPMLAKYYESKWWNDGTLIRDFIPCYRIADNEPGMYDIVNDVFYTNAGTGTYVVGNDVFPVTYENLLTDGDFADVAFSGSYTDLKNTPTIPTVNNGTLTIKKNGVTVQTFTANQSSNVTANITVPTKTSDLTNDSNFITDASYITITLPTNQAKGVAATGTLTSEQYTLLTASERNYIRLIVNFEQDNTITSIAYICKKRSDDTSSMEYTNSLGSIIIISKNDRGYSAEWNTNIVGDDITIEDVNNLF